MGISEFTVHNVLRTYARQERLGKVQQLQAKTAPGPTRTADQVSLSPAGHKVRVLGQLAAEVVDRRFPDAAPDTRLAKVRTTRDELLARHRDEVADERLTPEAFEARLSALYLG